MTASMTGDHTFEVIQDGIVVTVISSLSRGDALQEAWCYAVVHGQGWPLEIRDSTNDTLVED